MYQLQINFDKMEGCLLTSVDVLYQMVGLFDYNMKGTWHGQESICRPVSLKSNLLLFANWPAHPYIRTVSDNT